MKEKILYFKDDTEYDEWLNTKPGLLELIKSAQKNKELLIIQIGDEIYLQHKPKNDDE